jgi:hypothetical protein
MLSGGGASRHQSATVSTPLESQRWDRECTGGLVRTNHLSHSASRARALRVSAMPTLNRARMASVTLIRETSRARRMPSVPQCCPACILADPRTPRRRHAPGPSRTPCSARARRRDTHGPRPCSRPARASALAIYGPGRCKGGGKGRWPKLTVERRRIRPLSSTTRRRRLLSWKKVSR